MNNQSKALVRAGLAGVLALATALPAFAQKDGMVPHSGRGLPAATTIEGAPLRIVVGDENSFQVFNADVPGVGQIFPSSSTGTADMGWFVRTDGVLYAPDFASHSGSATGGLGTYTPFQAQTISAVTGDGSQANPFQVTVNAGVASGLSTVQQVLYVNGDNYFRKRLTLTNGGKGPVDARIFLGGDIYLAGDDNGIPYLEGATTSPGGRDCGSPASYYILYIPQTPADTYTGTGYSNVWSQIGAGQLDGSAGGTTCIDNGAALQWNRTIAAGESVTIEAATSFGDVPDIAQFGVTSVVPASGSQGTSVNVTISGVGFDPATTFAFGAGITVSNVVIAGETSATATLAIDAAAAPGFRTVTATQTPGGLVASRANAFQVLGAGGGGPTESVALPVSGPVGLLLMVLALVAIGVVATRRRAL
ncbi:hypothetical protein ACQQ2N_00180 [Dokdonella sp. MW10]|uniref:hypothetical protein n=1 Tax=Dokdonella sp. MW10 TaxID=2992926 RepID=UPI003F803FBE